MRQSLWPDSLADEVDNRFKFPGIGIVAVTLPESVDSRVGMQPNVQAGDDAVYSLSAAEAVEERNAR